VTNLLQRVCVDCFPTRVRLISRGVKCPSACVTCDDPHEDSYHLFFHCKIAIDVLNAVNVWHLIAPYLNQFDNASYITFNLLQKLYASQVENVVTIMWSIWKSLNLKLWQQVSESTVTIMERAKHLLKGWKKANRNRVLQVRFTYLRIQVLKSMMVRLRTTSTVMLDGGNQGVVG